MRPGERTLRSPRTPGRGIPRGAADGVIEVKLHDLHQLFNTLDPSPFIEKDLDDDAEDFVTGWALEYPARQPLTLVIHLEQPPAEPEPRRFIEAAVQNFDLSRARQTRREFSQLMHDGRLSLFIGTSFLVACMTAVRLVGQFWSGHEFTAWLQEGLTIAGWVAMWHPLEIYLYSWWPVRRKLRILLKLSRVRVQIRVGRPA